MAHASDPKSKSPFLTAIEAAAYLRLEVRTLNNMRWRQEGPSWRKHGGRVVYHINELQYWSRRLVRHQNIWHFGVRDLTERLAHLVC